MILSNNVTANGESVSFPLYEAGSGTVRYDVHVRIEPGSDTVAALMVYDRARDYGTPQIARGGWITDPLEGTVSVRPTLAFRQRIAAEVWKRFGKYVPSEVLS